ncbi:lycopene cyclase domain-containing protein [Corynebacterium sp. ES2794-CONJ1]|uniref:lycopene cyclase domain-containing protein n=1 Tax=unclassified Corynebacterium TaxID=2624378 RepID=UPI0021671742|nr:MULTISPECIES: lycopene cyclase domain-containing protein [unclassified Corynebacterium]MCS4490567.1 lycopene cyclase domain-containing protein [Corynebacterium sp. ES2775-CONJ]MCS4492346.1 lycopene cyclase domain-containing protein [Corynebacterium sp. ES2715-CONJ3]MCS4532462.1 lycopene cyclase domain-containing protein [Corynebacterium sp. ES2730-CONJ]MCU9519857.1 lycopene cyclase domain-containing protein [Corynebacterium sp. ES2794-CONJ1]
MIYTLISVPFVLGAGVMWWRSEHRNIKELGIVTALLLILTAIFDNLMIWAKLVAYGQDQRLGLHLGLVPVEDFFYPIVAALFIAAWWKP